MGTPGTSFKIINDLECINPSNGHVKCTYCDPVLGCYKFVSPAFSLYYFVFSAPIERRINMDLDEWAKISVWKQVHVIPNPQPTIERQFYHFVHNSSTGHFEASFHIYLNQNDYVWIVNDRADTLFSGSNQHEIEFRVYQYTPIDIYRNLDCDD